MVLKSLQKKRLKIKFDEVQEEVSTPIQDDRDGLTVELDKQKRNTYNSYSITWKYWK